MNLLDGMKSYILKMLEIAGSGMKVLMLDNETINSVSMAFLMSEMMEHEVYLIERISNVREPIKHLKCVCYLRPTQENISLLCNELKKRNYISYYVFFSHSLPKQCLKQLAEADEFELVAEVHEFYGDYIPLSPFSFILDRFQSTDYRRCLLNEVLQRSVDGITGALLSMKRNPVIRFQNSSEASKQLGESIRSTIAREAALFDFRQSSKMVLLIIDRASDPITPLLNQWTYEAMVHELIGIKHNRVIINSTGKESSREITLSPQYDEFYKKNQYSNFGEIGLSIKTLVDEFQKNSQLVDTNKVESIQDLKKFLENYPNFRKASGTVDTHVSLMTELSRLVKEYALLEVSEAEQDLVCDGNHSSSLNKIRGLLNDSRIRLVDALRLLLLYSLRYQSNREEIANLAKCLTSRGATPENLQLIDFIQTFAEVKKGSYNKQYSTDPKKATKAVASLTKRLVKGLKGVENIYSQHEPLISDLLSKLIKGQLRESVYPFISNISSNPNPNECPNEVMLFIIGGATYEEALAVHKLNTMTPGVNIHLGSTCMHNSRTYLEEVMNTYSDKSDSNDLSGHIRGGGSDAITRSSLASRFGVGGVKYELLK